MEVFCTYRLGIVHCTSLVSQLEKKEPLLCELKKKMIKFSEMYDNPNSIPNYNSKNSRCYVIVTKMSLKC